MGAHDLWSLEPSFLEIDFQPNGEDLDVRGLPGLRVGHQGPLVFAVPIACGRYRAPQKQTHNFDDDER